MKLRDILKKANAFTNSPFGEVLASLVPGVGIADAILDTVSGAVGADVKTMNTGTVLNRIESMPPEARASLEEKQIELKIAESADYAAVAIAQEQNNSSTRPAIAMKMADLFCQFALASFALMGMAMVLDTALAFSDRDTFALKLAMDGLPWLAGAYGVPALGVIQQYFARRSDDKRTAMAGAVPMDSPPPGWVKSLASLVRK